MLAVHAHLFIFPVTVPHCHCVSGPGSAPVVQSAVTLVHFDASANVYSDMASPRRLDWMLCLAALRYVSRLHLLPTPVRTSHVLSMGLGQGCQSFINLKQS
jgi:hypothetical protein